MKVIDTESWTWFLFEHAGNLYLDAYCNISAFGYTYMIQLNDDEIEKYNTRGRDYLGELAHDIHYSVPIKEGSASAYRGRDVSSGFSSLASEAVKSWRGEAAGE